MITLDVNQRQAVEELKSGSILNGGVGSGKSLTGLWYYYEKKCRGDPAKYTMNHPTDLYIITTARKRDSAEWNTELANLGLGTGTFLIPTSYNVDNHEYKEIKITIDSWNNIRKYEDIRGCFFIFDEQKAIGSGVWAKTFIKIARKNDWLMLTATPGDTWLDYAPVFIANGFYRNRTEFINNHVVYTNYCGFPQVKRYINCPRLVQNKEKILVNLDRARQIPKVVIKKDAKYDGKKMAMVVKSYWNFEKSYPIENASQRYLLALKVVNSDKSRIKALSSIWEKEKKIIVFYNYNYERDAIEKWAMDNDVPLFQCNGKIHDDVPELDEWVYLVQYTAGAEGWNCISTNVIVFYSLNPSYKQMSQAAGRIDRRNSPFTKLYYYVIRTNPTALVERGIIEALMNKQDFNAKDFERLSTE